MEKEAIITEEFKDITNNDMHIIEAIGLGEDSTMSVVAKKLKITAGSLTTAVNSLVNKKYVTRLRGEEDRRVVYIRLTEKGRRAYRHHEEISQTDDERSDRQTREEEIPILIKTLENLAEFFRGYSGKV